MFGSPHHGVFVTCLHKRISFQAEWLAPMEAHLSKFQRYFVRYTTEDFLQAVLYSREPERVFEHYHTGIKALCDNFLAWFTHADRSIAPQPVDSFEVACDIKR
jgi:hypothetical protein